MDPTIDPRWRSLFLVGAWLAVAMLALVPVAIVGFAIAPPPATAADAFALFGRGPLLGLVALDLVYLVSVILAAALLVVLGVALWRTSPSLVVLALFLDVAGVAIYVASNPAFDMQVLAQHHAAATTEAARASYVAAGEAMLATYVGTAYNVSYVMAGLAGLLLALAMLRGGPFGQVTAWLGVGMNLLGLVPPTIGAVGMAAAFLFLVPFLPWLVLIARRLFRLARS